MPISHRAAEGSIIIIMIPKISSSIAKNKHIHQKFKVLRVCTVKAEEDILFKIKYTPASPIISIMSKNGAEKRRIPFIKRIRPTIISNKKCLEKFFVNIAVIILNPPYAIKEKHIINPKVIIVIFGRISILSPNNKSSMLSVKTKLKNLFSVIVFPPFIQMMT